MAVLREENWLGQQRVDTPHLRAVESAVCADFDVVAGRAMAGNQALVVTGFQLGNFSSGTQATSIQLATASSILMNVNSTQSGTFIWLEASQPVDTLNPATNANVTGSWTAGQPNYVGVDLTRVALASTADLVQFIDPNTLLEDPKDVPLGLVMQYVISISTTPFSATPNITPVAIVTLNSSGQVASSNGVQDARNLMWRLGTGGDSPNVDYAYPWPQGRSETAGLFVGGDKALGSLRDFIQASETRMWELGGGENWYSPTADRNVFMATTGVGLSSSAWFNWDGTYLTWTGITFTFDNSDETGTYFNDVANNTSNTALGTMADGDCIYVNLDRSSNHSRTGSPTPALVALRTPLWLLGSPGLPGSCQIIAQRVGSSIFVRGSNTAVGVPIPVATTSILGIVKLFQTPASSADPVVLNLNAAGTLAWTATNEGTPGIGLSVTAGTATTAATPGGVGIQGVGGVGYTSGLGGVGITGTGGDGTNTSGSYGGVGVEGTGGASVYTTEPGASGVYGVGGAPGATGSYGGIGVQGQGAAGGATSGPGGQGGYFAGGSGSVSGAGGGSGVEGTGGASGGGPSLGGAGGRFTGGTTGSTATIGSYGVVGTGSDAVGVTKQGGAGAALLGGAGGSTSGTGGYGLESTGGAGGGTGAGGSGITGTGGSAPGAGVGGDGVVGSGGTSSSGTSGYGGTFENGAGTGYAAINCKGYLYLGDGSDPGTTNPGEHLNRRNTIIGWARLTCSGTSTPTIEDGYNVASVAFDGSGYVVVTLTTGASSGVLCAVANGNLSLDGGTLSGLPNIITTTASTVKMGGLSGSTIYSISASSNAGDIHVICTGYL